MELNDFSKKLNNLLIDTYDVLQQVEEWKVKKNTHLNLTISELHLLEVIGKYGDDGASISDIANELSFTLPTITVAINKLAKKGYVTKTKSEEDKRMVYVTLTKMGQKVDNVHRYIHLKITRDIAKELEPDEQEALLRGLLKINTFFRQYLNN